MIVTINAAPLIPAKSIRMATGPIISSGDGEVGIVVSVGGVVVGPVGVVGE